MLHPIHSPDKTAVHIFRRGQSGMIHRSISSCDNGLALSVNEIVAFSKCYRAFYGRTPYRERGIPVIAAVA
jgi:hypothetical protein